MPEFDATTRYKPHGLWSEVTVSNEDGPHEAIEFSYELPIRCLCGVEFTEPTNDQAKWMAKHGQMAGVLMDAILHLDEFLPRRQIGPCCDSHVEPPQLCCDPIDCGPCCENCPTCPALHPELLSWLSENERRQFAMNAHQRAGLLDDPRYWGDVFPPPPQAFTKDAATARDGKQLRLMHLAAVLDPDHYREAPMEAFRRQEARDRD